MASSDANTSEPRLPAVPRPCIAAAEAALQALFRAGLDPASTVVLVGSTARGAQTPRSDVDVLVLNEDGKRVALARPGETHLQQDSRARFLRRLRAGDDYPAWALRLGVPPHDADGWWAEQAAAEKARPHWPDWRPKAHSATKRLHLATELLGTGDVDAAREELLLAASHLARAILLRDGMFPLSRPELPDQLQAVDAELAKLLRRLIFDDASAEAWQPAMSMLASKLTQLTEAPDKQA